MRNSLIATAVAVVSLKLGAKWIALPIFVVSFWALQAYFPENLPEKP